MERWLQNLVTQNNMNHGKHHKRNLNKKHQIRNNLVKVTLLTKTQVLRISQYSWHIHEQLVFQGSL